ncbi:trypsin-like peptidase domain-containing protein [Paenibacillus sp. EKM102P]|uniref:S1 family peptidase n=1 Tax=unclassified Paenibacillus TaxID=185978 RepID=UPI00142DF9C2|nr:MULTISPECIES: serine protease [unclassified Paenibacillus]KAF6618276.1 trypsin-like peptidase domain-containing protein [Paenibacillus sp. EKM101P]KAF6624621.1 trypsin-like peptidase domain-containing protein [Paenibacillus sp. EKM102P]KAF6635600.1 trypsin-like peptidase domain-containing protein [Paenibacillus sp. EKM10P]KAF6648690.1 trypsin-like peptidase domain-containing protein [Paenibacillus sp. EKM11P]
MTSSSSSGLSISEQLMYSTVRIESMDVYGNVSTGTGFYYRMLDNGESHVSVIVTNKHVVEGGSRGRFVINLASEEGRLSGNDQEVFSFDNFESMWIKHPDPDVDLCIMPFVPIIREAEARGLKLAFVMLDEKLVYSDEQLSDLTAIEDIVMVGYPNGIWDKVNNHPIIRRGITATHPGYDYNGKEEFLIDAACFPGSSGSPVLLLNQGSYANKSGDVILGNRVALLGILYGGPQYTTTGEVRIVDVPTRQQAISVSSIPNNLGIIIKAKKLIDFEPILSEIIKNQGEK